MLLRKFASFDIIVLEYPFDLGNAGPFSPEAELVNGRAAALGLVALAALEYKAGGVPFF
jgi:hypothetical protein